MADFTIHLDREGNIVPAGQGVPFRSKGFSTRARAEQALIKDFQKATPAQRDKAFADRLAQLEDLGVDLGRNFATEGLGRGEKLLIGAGRTFTEVGRGLSQRAAEAGITDGVLGLDFSGGGIPRLTGSSLEDSRRTEANERELFDILDSEGIGFEDAGQLLPELFAFAGSGGLGLVARGAALGASKATTREGTVGFNALISGATAGLGGAAGAAVGRIIGALGARMFKKSASFKPETVDGLAAVLQGIRHPSEGIKRIHSLFQQADELSKSKEEATRAVGRKALKQAQQIIQEMNTVGKKAVMKRELNSILQRSTKVNDLGDNTLNIGEFLRGVENFSRGTLGKNLLKSTGLRIDTLRNTFKEIGKLNKRSTSFDDSVKILNTMFDDPVSRQIAAKMGKNPPPTMVEALLRRVERFSAQAGAAAPQ